MIMRRMLVDTSRRRVRLRGECWDLQQMGPDEVSRLSLGYGKPRMGGRWRAAGQPLQLKGNNERFGQTNEAK